MEEEEEEEDTVHYYPQWPSNQKFVGSPEKILNNENRGPDCTIDGFLLLILHDS